MGLYHNVYLIYGARITKNEMNPNLWESVENMQENDEGYSDLWLATVGDGNAQFLTLSSEEIETNSYKGFGQLPELDEEWTLLKKAADKLDIEIEDPRWYILHDYS
jgi:hypothetical protein